MSGVAAVAGKILVGLLIAATGLWGVLAITYLGPSQSALRYGLSVAFALLALGTLIAIVRCRLYGLIMGVYVFFLTLLIGWFFGVEPSNKREWQKDVAVLPYASVKGDIVTFYNIRNFDYRSETDYTPAYYKRRFDLRELEGIDIVTVYWMGPAVAHVFLSFGFSNGDHLAVSIETRKEKGEAYSTLQGFFRQYELYYVVADERDVIRLRTNYRHEPPEEVYVYPINGTAENGRRLFLEYVKRINALKKHPEFYNSLTTNCTTNIWLNSRVNPDHLPFSWKIIASGYLPEYLYENGRLKTGGRSFAELREQVHVNERAQAADRAADFSSRIRKPLP